MRIGAFEIREPIPELRQPHAIAVLRPWIDVGSVGTLALSRLERHFGTQELGRLARPGTFFDFTRYRPTIRYIEGHRVLTIPNTVINYARQEGGPDFLFLHLLEPHAFAEEYTESIVELLKTFGVQRYCRIGGFYDAVPHTRPLLVSGTAGGRAEGWLGKIRVRRSTYQGPTTIMNLVNEGMERLGVESLSFMVHLPQYIQLEEDYAGTARLLEVLSCLYDLPRDLPEVEQGLRQYRELSAEIERNPSLKALIERLESYYDARVAAGEEESPPLSPEVERFLRELGERFNNH